MRERILRNACGNLMEENLAEIELICKERC